MLAAQLKESFRRFAGQHAFFFGDQYFTYRHLEKKALSVAGQIFRSVKKNNPRIAIVTHNDFTTYASVFATWLCGGVFVPLNPRYPKERNAVMIKQAHGEVVLNSQCCGDYPGEINTSEECGLLLDFPDILVEPKDLMYILFTSGSTGEPKGVPITYANVNAFITSFLANNYYFSPSDRFLQPFDLTFDASLDSYLIPALYGSCVYPVPTDGMRYLQSLRILQTHQITVAKMTPSMVSLLKPYFPKIKLPAMRYCLFGGEGLSEQLVREWAGCIPNARIHNLYGPTEATVECFFYDATPSAEMLSYKGMVSIGKPTGDTSAIIAGTDGQPLPDGNEGELWLTGSQITPGYLNSKELNRTAFLEIRSGKRKQRFYKTGDIAMKNEKGYFFCLGRNDRQVKVQGYRVELDEIEVRASSVAPASRFAAIIRNEKIVLFTDLTETAAVAQALPLLLPPWMLPAEIITIPAIPVNSNGKTDYKSLQEYE